MSESHVLVDEGTAKKIRAILELTDKYTPVVKISKGSGTALQDLLEKADFDAKFDITHSAFRDAILGASNRTLTDLFNTLGTENTLALIKAKTDNLDVLLSTRLAEGTFTGRINTLGQKTMAGSTPVVIASDQSSLPVSSGEEATYVVQNSAAQASAANKHFISLFNASGSGKTMKIYEIWARYTQAAAVTGVGFNLQIKRAIAQGSGGTSLTPKLYDENDVAIPAQITALQAPTGAPTEQDILRDFFTATEGLMETTGHAGVLTTIFPIFRKQNGLRPLVCREGKGITIKQITSSTVGNWSIEILFSLV